MRCLSNTYQDNQSLSNSSCNTEKLKGERNVESKQIIVELFFPSTGKKKILVSISLILNSEEDFSKLPKGLKLRIDWLIFYITFPISFHQYGTLGLFSLASLCTDLSIVNASILCLSREFFPSFQRLAAKKIYVTFKRIISNLPFQMPFWHLMM